MNRDQHKDPCAELGGVSSLFSWVLSHHSWIKSTGTVVDFIKQHWMGGIVLRRAKGKSSLHVASSFKRLIIYLWFRWCFTVLSNVKSVRLIALLQDFCFKGVEEVGPHYYRAGKGSEDYGLDTAPSVMWPFWWGHWLCWSAICFYNVSKRVATWGDNTEHGLLFLFNKLYLSLT